MTPYRYRLVNWGLNNLCVIQAKSDFHSYNLKPDSVRINSGIMPHLAALSKIYHSLVLIRIT